MDEEEFAGEFFARILGFLLHAYEHSQYGLVIRRLPDTNRNEITVVKTMLRLLALSFLVFLIPQQAWSAEPSLSVAEAINKSGRQRMLSQRMMKSYLMVGSDVKVDAAQRQLDASVTLFEEQLQELRQYATTSNSFIVAKKLDEVIKIWSPHRQLITAKPTKSGLFELLAMNRQLLVASNEVVKAIAKHANMASAELVNIAGRQRMLSQRIAKVYIALFWEINDPTLRNEFDDAVKLFDESLTRIEGYDKNSPEIKRALRDVRNRWKLSQRMFKLEDGGSYAPLLMAVTTESILKKMNHVTGLYEELVTAQASR